MHQRLRRLQRKMMARRTVAAVALALALAGCSGDDENPPLPIPPQEGSFSLLTYNIAGLPQGISGSNPETNIPLISPLLNGYDLVLVQEDFSYHEQLIADVQHPYQSTPKQYFVKLVHDGLNRFSQFPFEPVERIQWDACYGDATTGAADCLAEKGFSRAPTTFGERVVFQVYNMHVEAGSNPEDLAARETGIGQLITFLNARSPDDVVILAGDTNLRHSDPEDEPLLKRLVNETGLQDVCDYLSCGDDRIDRIYFRDNAVIALEPTSWSVPPEFVTQGGDDLSDHKPVHATFNWHTR